MEQGIPRNPFNAGALVVCDMLQDGLARRVSECWKLCARFAGMYPDITYDATVARSPI